MQAHIILKYSITILSSDVLIVFNNTVLIREYNEPEFNDRFQETYNKYGEIDEQDENNDIKIVMIRIKKEFPQNLGFSS